MHSHNAGFGKDSIGQNAAFGNYVGLQIPGLAGKKAFEVLEALGLHSSNGPIGRHSVCSHGLYKGIKVKAAVQAELA